MQIAVNIDHLITPEGRPKTDFTGTEQYVDSLLSSLYDLATPHRISAFAPCLASAEVLRQGMDGDAFRWLACPQARVDTIGTERKLAEKPQIARSRVLRFIARRIDKRLLDPWKSRTRVKRTRAASRRYDLIHLATPSYMPLEAFDARRTIATIYDMTVRTFSWAHSRDNIAAWEHFFSYARRRCSRFITISEAAKCEISEHLEIPLDRIDVTPLAARSTTGRIEDPRILSAALSPLDLADTPFVLYAGTLEPRKNLERLIKAFARVVHETHLPEHKLVLAGGNWNRFDLELRLLALEQGIGGRVVTTGYVSNHVMNALMSACDAFAYVSLSEGFGLPPLEAMICGAPVITSNISSMPEVVGEAGIQVSPRDTEEVAAALHRLLTDSAENARRRAMSLERARQFTWKRTAALTLQSYEAALS